MDNKKIIELCKKSQRQIEELLIYMYHMADNLQQESTAVEIGFKLKKMGYVFLDDGTWKHENDIPDGN